ncbi:MAG: RcpC/CpaB family pilus assembly protein [Solirubrobacteraceae bacterium]
MPRLSLSRLNHEPSSPADGNGRAPKVRMREQPASTRRTSGARRLLSPLPLAGIALVLIALIGYMGVYAAAGKRTTVLVAARTLPAGTVLSASDLRTGQLAGEASTIATLIPGGERSQIVGQRLSSTVPAGAPLPAGALISSPTKSAAMVLSVPAADVTGERLEPGDRVSVLGTFGAGSASATTRAVARNLEVLAVGAAPASTGGSTATVPVTLAVASPSLASSLALTNEDGKLDLLLEGSGTATAAIPPVTEKSTP